MTMRAKSLRELQQKGEKAIGTRDPVLLTSRKGPVGILVPVTAESLPYVQAEIQKLTALRSLRETWSLARDASLDELSDAEIEKEIRAARHKPRKPRSAR